MRCARVYQAINLVSAEIASLGIAKAHTNSRENYQYRSIDDVLERLAPILAKQKLCVLPRVLERTAIERGPAQEVLISVTLKVAFDLVSADDGSFHTIEAYGEALDAGDKATAKAMSSAYKMAAVQTFCIPASGNADPDGSGHQIKAHPFLEPVEGWADWSEGIIQTIAICQSGDALDLVQKTHRNALISIKREQPTLYANIGSAFAARIAELQLTANATPIEGRTATSATNRRRRPKARTGQSEEKGIAANG